MIVVLIHHNVDGGYQETQLFESKTDAEDWLRENGYQPDGETIGLENSPGGNCWIKPVYSEWDDPSYLQCPAAFEMEVAEVYEQGVKP